MRAVHRLVQGVPGVGVRSRLWMRAQLQGLRLYYRFTRLRLVREGGHFEVDARMNPRTTVDDSKTVDKNLVDPSWPRRLTPPRTKDFDTSRRGNTLLFAWAGSGSRRDSDAQWVWVARRGNPLRGHWQQSRSQSAVAAAERAARTRLQATKNDYVDLVPQGRSPFSHGPDTQSLGRDAPRGRTDRLTLGEVKTSHARTGRNFNADEFTSITGERLETGLERLRGHQDAAIAQRVEAALRNGQVEFVIFLAGADQPGQGRRRARLARRQRNRLARTIRADLRAYIATAFSSLQPDEVQSIVRRVNIRYVNL